MTQRVTRGVHHVGLTVPDLGAAKVFFSQGLGFETVGEIADYPAVFLSDGTAMVTLWQAEDPARALDFDRRHHIGLHHLAFQVGDLAALKNLHERLGARDDVSVEFPPEPLGAGPTHHMMCRIPGAIRVEFIASEST